MANEDVSRSLTELSNALSSLSSLSDSQQLVFDWKETELKIDTYIPLSQNDMTKAILRSFFHHLPSDGSRVFCRYIAESHQQDSLTQLADHLNAAILAPMRTCGGKTPQISPSPFGGPDDVASNMGDSCTRNVQSELKAQCLKRDNYRCVVTGQYDMKAVGNITGVSDDHVRMNTVDTHLSHIMPFALGQFKNEKEVSSCIYVFLHTFESNLQEKDKANIWTTMNAMFPSLRDIIKADQVNEPRNVMTMWSPLNTHFGNLSFALKPTEENDTYEIVTYNTLPGRYLNMDFPRPSQNGKRYVKFERHPDSDLDPPSRVLLETHAAVAQILHSSGMSEVIDAALRDAEELKCLASDGSTDLQRLLPCLLVF